MPAPPAPARFLVKVEHRHGHAHGREKFRVMKEIPSNSSIPRSSRKFLITLSRSITKTASFYQIKKLALKGKIGYSQSLSREKTMDDTFKIFVRRLKDGHEEVIQEVLSSDFIDIHEG